MLKQRLLDILLMTAAFLPLILTYLASCPPKR